MASPVIQPGGPTGRPDGERPPVGKPTEGSTRPSRRGSLGKVLRAAVLFLALGVAGLTTLVLSRVIDAAQGAPVRGVSDGSGAPPLRSSHPDFAVRASALSEMDLIPGHAVEVLPDTLLFTRLFADLESAQRSITFLGYYCEPGRVGERVTGVLTERARAGVAVLFLGDDFGCGALLDEIEPSLVSAGVRVARFRPVRWYSLHRAQHRMHARSVVIDGAVGYTGGFGIADKWMYDTPEDPLWRETSARFTGPTVADMQALFLTGWAEASGELVTGDVFFPSAHEGTDDEVENGFLAGREAAAGTPSNAVSDTLAAAQRTSPEAGLAPRGEGVTAGLLYSRPVIGTTTAERFLAATLAAAERTLYVTNSYFVPTPLMRDLLLDAAHRGVDVRILVPDEHTDIPTTRYAGRSFYQELMAAGIRIYEYQPAMIHAKTLVVDGRWTALGTLNLDNRSLRLNDESALVMDDVRMGALMDSLFLADLARSQEITLESHAERPMRERLLEWLSRRMAALL
jgi:cardiolipin synthase